MNKKESDQKIEFLESAIRYILSTAKLLKLYDTNSLAQNEIMTIIKICNETLRVKDESPRA